MKLVLISSLLALLTQSTGPTSAPTAHQRRLQVPDVGTMTYGISVPNDYNPQQPRPLVLALHPGGERRPGYGNAFMVSIISPALNDLHPIIVAPDCPGQSWTDPNAERGVMALLQSVRKDYAIDGRRILVTGYSMGGRGTWFMSSQHPELFTAAIVIAGSPRDMPPDRLATIPTYVIHSRDDQVVPFEPAQRTTQELEKMGRIVKFEALQGLGHYEMGGYVDAIRRAGRWVGERWER
jgi:predicted peptidase